MNLHHDEVRKQRSTLAVCPSAKENVCVPGEKAGVCED